MNRSDLTGTATTLIRALLLSLILYLTAATSPLIAQNGGYAGAYTRLGFGPRGMAMGNAMTAVTSEGSYGHYNAALAARPLQKIDIDLGTSAMAFDRSLHHLNAAFPLTGDANINIALLNASVDNIDGRSVSGYDTGSLSTQEIQLKTYIGVKYTSWLSAGAGIGLHYADLHNELASVTGAGFDLGLLIEPTNNLNIGLAVKDLLASYQLDAASIYSDNNSQQTTDNFPRRFKAGVSYHPPFVNQLLISGDVEVRKQTSEYFSYETLAGNGSPAVIRNTETANTSTVQARMGVRYRVHEFVSLRTGYQIRDLDHTSNSDHPSAGFSIKIPVQFGSPWIDYAFVRQPSGLSSMHVFAIRMSL